MDLGAVTWAEFRNSLARHDCFAAAQQGGELDAMRAEGNALFKANSFNKAIAAYTEALVSSPDDHVLYSNRALCHARLGHWKAAETDAARCIGLCGSFIKSYRTLARALDRQGRPMDAHCAVARGLEIDPADTELLKLRVAVRQTLGTHEAAIRRRSKALDPQNPSHARDLALAEHGSVLAPALVRDKFVAFAALFEVRASAIDGVGAFATRALKASEVLFDIDLRRDSSSWLAPETLLSSFPGLTLLLSSFNDAAMPDFDGMARSKHDALDMLDRYAVASTSKCTVALEIDEDAATGCTFLPTLEAPHDPTPVRFRVTAVRDVAAREELTYSYHASTWIAMHMRHASDIGDGSAFEALNDVFLTHVRARLLASADDASRRELLFAAWNYRIFCNLDLQRALLSPAAKR